jgi:hypothetical protein
MFDSTYFLTQVKVKSSPPEGRFTDEEILQLANDTLVAQVVPMIINLKEEFYVTYEDQNITANTNSYPIPYRALGLSLREVKKIQNDRIIDLDRVSPEVIRSTNVSDNTEGFYLLAQDVVLYPTPSTTQDVLRQYYFLTPSRIVKVTECGAITNIDRVTGVITASVPSTWTTANLFDLSSQRNGHRTLGRDLTATAVTTSDVTLALADIPSTLLVGDYISLAGETPYLQCPDNCFELVIRLTANELLESMGAQAELAIGIQKANDLRTSVMGLLTNRVTGAPKRSRITLI